VNGELEKYKSRVADNLQSLTSYMARLGVALDFDTEIEVPDDDEPLAELFAFLKIIQDNLRDLEQKHRQSIDELEEKVRQRVSELERKDKTIHDQSQAIRELSTPVVQLWDRIVMLPLIGAVDSARGKQVGRHLLEAISRFNAAVAIIDITGVPVVDMAVAGYLVQAIRASRLLGAEVIVAGVSPRNALTLTRLGANLSDVSTVGSLKTALTRAMGLVREA
jgi:anti-anti-sigma regulatory factor